LAPTTKPPDVMSSKGIGVLRLPKPHHGPGRDYGVRQQAHSPWASP